MAGSTTSLAVAVTICRHRRHTLDAATQDIVIDAYRIESAPTEEQAMISSTYIAGYRIGMIVAGAGALYLATYFGDNIHYS